MADLKKLNKIIYPIRNDLQLFKNEFSYALKSDVKLINIISDYLIKNNGKGIRPILMIFISKLCGKTTSNTYKAAAMVELLHLATLIHDDVVDKSEKRRGFPTIHKIWGNKTAVIMGDFILSQVLKNLISLRDFDSLDLISSTAKRLSSGEMLQIEGSIKKSMSEKKYIKMIKDKTASLMSTSTKLGAITSNAKDEFKKASFDFGENLGVAFQIKDDLLDILGSSYKTGKDSNADVSSNMITLPMIHILENKLSSSTKSLIKNALSKKASKRELIDLKKIINEEGGINYAQKKLKHYTDIAVSSLDIMPNNEFKDSLIEICEYNIIRNR
tara:strand:+ start:8798 stop:9784 length:987 start_codon:yes stop_codon:yes gene_type:complete